MRDLSDHEKALRKLLETCKEQGWKVYGVNDGEWVPVTDERDVELAVFAVDDCIIKFRKGTTVRNVTWTICNDWDECLVDCSEQEGSWDKAMENYFNWLSSDSEERCND